MLRRFEPLAHVIGVGVLYFGIVPAALAYCGARGLLLKLRDRGRQ